VGCGGPACTGGLETDRHDFMLSRI